MNWTHLVTGLVLLVIGYWLGTKYPGWLSKGTGGLVSG
jgi:hypothetical protein